MLIRALVRFVLLCCSRAIPLMICMVRLVYPLLLPCPKMKGLVQPALAVSAFYLVNFVTFLLQRSARNLPCSLVAVAVQDQRLTEILLKPRPKPISSRLESPMPSKTRTHLILTRPSFTNPTHQNSSADLDTIRVRLV